MDTAKTRKLGGFGLKGLGGGGSLSNLGKKGSKRGEKKGSITPKTKTQTKNQKTEQKPPKKKKREHPA